MSAKIKTIKLSFPHFDQSIDIQVADRFSKPQVYRVEQVTNTTEFAPSQQLSKKQVDELCAAIGWQVTIVPVKS